MPLSRRGFFRSASAGAVGTLLAPYVSGRGLEALGLSPELRAADARWVPTALRLDSNENPDGPGDAVLAAIRAGFGEANRYPHGSVAALRAALAQSFGVSGDNVALGCGSSDILRASVYAFCSESRPLVTASPSFENPATDARRIGAGVREVRVTSDLELDLDGMAQAARGAGLVYLCNPNNPTSTVHGDVAVRSFIDRGRSESPATTILVDEAYHEYVADSTYASALPIAMRNPRVFVVRTFSKVYGMAGMRLGFAIGDSETMKSIATHTLNAGINELAATGALEALKGRAHVAQETQRNAIARALTLGTFGDAGFRAANSQANFVMVNLRRSAQPFREACAKSGVLVGRPFPPLDNYIRISIGTVDEMKQAADVFRSILSTSYEKA